MKDLKFVLILFGIGFCLSANSQDISRHAVGVRLGSGNGFGPEISYQGYLQSNNRLDIGLRMKDHQGFIAYKLRGLYQWVFPMPGEFQWFGGLGVSTGLVNFNSVETSKNSAGMLGLESVLGLEYSFKKSGMPIQLMLELNPKLDLMNEYSKSNFEFDVSVGLRYLF